MKLKVIQKGTHILPVSEWNNDRPNPAEMVAEALAEFEFKLGELIKVGGACRNEKAYKDAKHYLFGLDLALNAASNQNWQLELDK